MPVELVAPALVAKGVLGGAGPAALGGLGHAAGAAASLSPLGSE